MSEIEVREDEPSLFKPDIIAEFPGIELETDFDKLGGPVLALIRPAGPSFTDCAAATRINYGLDNTDDIVPETRGVEEINGVEVKSKDSDNESEPNEKFDEDSVVGVETEETEVEDVHVGPRRSSWTARAPNRLLPTTMW